MVYQPKAKFESLAELIARFVRLFDSGVVTRDPDDPRLPSLRDVPLTGDVRRLPSSGFL